MGKCYFNLKMLRKMLGITQYEIAEKLGCDKATYCKMENGNIRFPLQKATKVSEIINLALNTMGKEAVSMEFIFFTVQVPNMEQRGD